jgi:hypothetical protein
MPLAVSDLGLCFISASKPISVVQFLKLRDLSAETTDLSPKHFEVIHAVKDTTRRKTERRTTGTKIAVVSHSAFI